MKRSLKIAVAAAVALSATSAFATNGDQLIGLGAKSRAMGGTGIAAYMGAESALSNPALLTKTKGTDVSFGGTVFMPKVKQTTTMTDPVGATVTGSDTSKADMNVIPEVAIASEISPGVVWGVGMFGSAGMGVDYRDGTKSPLGMQMSTTLQLMKMAPSIAFEVTPGLSLGVAGVLQYGALDIAYNPGTGMTGNGLSQDFGFGYELGAAYEAAGLTVGAVYKSAIDMSYAHQIDAATQAFGLRSGAGFAANLEQPAEYGIGVAYNLDALTLTADFKRIKWADAKGYKDFNWEDQNVYAVGAAYAMGDVTLRVGYNYGKNPIKALPAATMMDYDGAVVNQFNLLGFPATVQSHYTAGLTYQVNPKMSLDLAYVYAAQVSDTFDTSGMTQAMAFQQLQGAPYNMDPTSAAAAASNASSSIKTTHSQQSVAAGINFHF